MAHRHGRRPPVSPGRADWAANWILDMALYPPFAGRVTLERVTHYITPAGQRIWVDLDMTGLNSQQDSSSKAHDVLMPTRASRRPCSRCITAMGPVRWMSGTRDSTGSRRLERVRAARPPPPSRQYPIAFLELHLASGSLPCANSICPDRASSLANAAVENILPYRQSGCQHAQICGLVAEGADAS